MDEKNWELAQKITGYAGLSKQHESTKRALRELLSQQQIPIRGLPRVQVEHLVREFALMDSNNFCVASIGEREGRVHSEFVRERNLFMSHGIGRSGDLTASQPKAAGSTLVQHLANRMLLHALKLRGARGTSEALCVPMCTGMTVMLVLLALVHRARVRVRRSQLSTPLVVTVPVVVPPVVTVPHVTVPVTVPLVVPPVTPHATIPPVIVPSTTIPPTIPPVTVPPTTIPPITALPIPTPTIPTPDVVLWMRIDQQSVPKAVQMAGLTLLPIEPLLRGDALESNLELLEQYICVLRDRVLCVISTTSCFAPRLPDRVVQIAELCHKYDVAHVVNNAYGVQSSKIMNQLQTAMHRGRVDVYVQSTDKNFLVPVGGAVVASGSRNVKKWKGSVRRNGLDKSVGEKKLDESVGEKKLDKRVDSENLLENASNKKLDENVHGNRLDESVHGDTIVHGEKLRKRKEKKKQSQERTNRQQQGKIGSQQQEKITGKQLSQQEKSNDQQEKTKKQELLILDNPIVNGAQEDTKFEPVSVDNQQTQVSPPDQQEPNLELEQQVIEQSLPQQQSHPQQEESLVSLVSTLYAGRASAAPSLDVFITLISMGQDTFQNLFNEREQVHWPYFLNKIQVDICAKYGERLLDTQKFNTISFAMTLDAIGAKSKRDVSELGSFLFYRGVTGTRVVKRNTKKVGVGIQFQGYGSHCNNYPHDYLTMACALGITRQEIDQFVHILDNALGDFIKT